MTKQMNELINTLKEAGEDFEFYPTTRDMVRRIWKFKLANRHGHYGFGTVLDIGAGKCDFRKWMKEFNRENPHAPSADISEYFVIEKSRILIDRLAPDVIVLGTDFNETTLIDKEVDTIFCNPPYSEYEEWTKRIILESNCDDIFLIIPSRWKQSETIQLALRSLKAPFGTKLVSVLGQADFLSAERNARAKVDILHIDKSWQGRDAGFDYMFDELFQMDDAPDRDMIRWACDEEEKKREALRKALTTGKNKVEILCDGYEAARKQLYEHFKKIASLDPDLLASVGVHKDNVKEALKRKYKGLKNLYWSAAFDCLDEITSRLTSESRRKILSDFSMLKQVDFTPSNLYAMIVWVIKNYNKFTEQQMIDLFIGLSSKENVRNYVSNKRVFEDFCSRYSSDAEKNTHYTLDYRIICTEYALPGEGWHSWDNHITYACRTKIEDVCAVANSLGFQAGEIQLPETWGKRGTVYMADEKTVLFAFRCYLNRNVHIKFNIELMKALNVAVARKLGWIRKPSDIAQEFTPEMAKGAERYFNCFRLLDVSKVPCLLGMQAMESCSVEERDSEPTLL